MTTDGMADNVFRVLYDGKWIFDEKKLRLFNTKEQAKNYRNVMIEKYDLHPSKAIIAESVPLENIMNKSMSFKRTHPGVKIVWTSLKEDVIMSELILFDSTQPSN